jgi:hypothetical protein
VTSGGVGVDAQAPSKGSNEMVASKIRIFFIGIYPD